MISHQSSCLGVLLARLPFTAGAVNNSGGPQQPGSKSMAYGSKQLQVATRQLVYAASQLHAERMSHGHTLLMLQQEQEMLAVVASKLAAVETSEAAARRELSYLELCLQGEQLIHNQTAESLAQLQTDHQQLQQQLTAALAARADADASTIVGSNKNKRFARRLLGSAPKLLIWSAAAASAVAGAKSRSPEAAAASRVLTLAAAAGQAAEAVLCGLDWVCAATLRKDGAAASTSGSNDQGASSSSRDGTGAAGAGRNAGSKQLLSFPITIDGEDENLEDGQDSSQGQLLCSHDGQAASSVNSNTASRSSSNGCAGADGLSAGPSTPQSGHSSSAEVSSDEEALLVLLLGVEGDQSSEVKPAAGFGAVEALQNNTAGAVDLAVSSRAPRWSCPV